MTRRPGGSPARQASPRTTGSSPGHWRGNNSGENSLGNTSACIVVVADNFLPVLSSLCCFIEEDEEVLAFFFVIDIFPASTAATLSQPGQANTIIECNTISHNTTQNTDHGQPSLRLPSRVGPRQRHHQHRHRLTCWPGRRPLRLYIELGRQRGFRPRLAPGQQCCVRRKEQ